MRRLAILLGAGLLLALLIVLAASSTLAWPGMGGDVANCMSCHDGTNPNAGDSFSAQHDGAVGECLTCHAAEKEAIHGTWTDLTEACARCHRTHSAAADDLLIMGKDALCQFCHGTTAGLAQTNVLDGLLRYNTGSLRGGGFDNATMNTDSPDPAETWAFPVSDASVVQAATTSEHSLGVTALIWGSGDVNAVANAGDSTTTLECVSCHDPHAYGRAYRMLRPQPTGSSIGGHGSTEYAMVTDILAAGNLSYTTDDYAATPEDYSPWVIDADGNQVMITAYGGYGPDFETPKYSQQVNLWCASCHERYHATKSGTTAPGSTDSGDAIFAFQHKTGDQVVDRIVPDANGLPTLVLDAGGDPVLVDGTLTPITDPADLVELYELDLGADGVPGGGDDTYVLSHNADGDQNYLVTDATPTEVLDEAGDPIPVFLADGTPLGNLLEQHYAHEAYAYSCGYNGENCHGGTKNFNRMLSCLGCHVSHGTSASMGTYASSVPWPGEDSTTADGLPGTAEDVSAMARWLDVDDLNGQYADSDWSDRSSLLRLDNRGVCQNAYCHPKGNDNMHFGPDDFEQGQDFDYGGGGDH